MADNLTTQSTAPATPAAGTKIATREVTYSGDTGQHMAPVALVELSGAAKVGSGNKVNLILQPKWPMPVRPFVRAEEDPRATFSQPFSIALPLCPR